MKTFANAAASEYSSGHSQGSLSKQKRNQSFEFGLIQMAQRDRKADLRSFSVFRLIAQSSDASLFLAQPESNYTLMEL